MDNEIYDIAIIGGGPAGSAASIFLAKGGLKVCLFEKKRFPRETLCGEFLSKEVIDIIEELKLFEKFLAFHPNKIDSFRLINDNGKEISANLNFHAYGLRRSTLDNLLLNEAIKKGVKVFQPFEIIRVENIGNDFLLSAQNDVIDYSYFKSKFVISAYGKQSTLDQTFHRNFIKRKSFLNGVKFHIPKSELNYNMPNEIRIFLSNGIYCGMNEVDNDIVTLCFLENRMILKNTSRSNLIECVSRNKMLKNIIPDNIIAKLNKLPAYGNSNIYFGKRKLIENRTFMIGDAGGIIAPIAGDGIGMALQSGKLIADVLLKSKKENLSLNEAQMLYQNSWQKLFSKRIYYGLFIQKILLESRLKNLAINFVYSFPFVLPKLIDSTRSNSIF